MNPPRPLAPDPQGVESLRRRFPLAVDHVHDFEINGHGVGRPPAEDPEHVFDFFDGFRLVVARERTPGGSGSPPVVWLHVVGSAVEGSLLKGRSSPGQLGSGPFGELSVCRYRIVSGDDGPLRVRGFTAQNGVSHLFRAEPGGGVP